MRNKKCLVALLWPHAIKKRAFRMIFIADDDQTMAVSYNKRNMLQCNIMEAIPWKYRNKLKKKLMAELLKDTIILIEF